MTNDEMKKIIEMVYTNYGNNTGDRKPKELLKLWNARFKDYSFEKMEKIMFEVFDRCKYFPTISDIVGGTVDKDQSKLKLL